MDSGQSAGGQVSLQTTPGQGSEARRCHQRLVVAAALRPLIRRHRQKRDISLTPIRIIADALIAVSCAANNQSRVCLESLSNEFKAIYPMSAAIVAISKFSSGKNLFDCPSYIPLQSHT
jgi:hypothetical protein